ncbi:holin [Streptomyces sp. x-80]|uniref:holin n=1 Tax=Streptomyces sp. x-80 TaxID=2789282 RepID=UPI0039804F7E
MMITKAFWATAAERAIKTFAQALLAVLGAGAFGLLDAPWTDALSTAGMAAVLSFLTTIATANRPFCGVDPDAGAVLVRSGVVGDTAGVDVAPRGHGGGSEGNQREL